MPSVMNIHLLRQPYENMNAMAVFCKYATPARIIFKTLRDAALILRMLSRRKTVFTKSEVNHSHSQSAAVIAEITLSLSSITRTEEPCLEKHGRRVFSVPLEEHLIF